MNIDRKKRLAGFLWGLFLVWPLAQMGLALGFKINPWKFAGWGMYSTPFEHPEVTILEARGGKFIRAEDSPLPPGARPKIEEFARRRFGVGRLESPVELGAWVLENAPGWEGVGIALKTQYIERATGRVAAAEEYFVYYRNGDAR